MTRPCDLNATEARKLIGNKQLSPVELTTSCIEQIEKHNPSINAVVAIDKNDVLKQAKKKLKTKLCQDQNSGYYMVSQLELKI